MADKSAIEWTDATWNPVTGCLPEHLHQTYHPGPPIPAAQIPESTLRIVPNARLSESGPQDARSSPSPHPFDEGPPPR
jgi:hypothetical protein